MSVHGIHNWTQRHAELIKQVIELCVAQHKQGTKRLTLLPSYDSSISYQCLIVTKSNDAIPTIFSTPQVYETHFLDLTFQNSQ